MQGIYSYMRETNHVSTIHRVINDLRTLLQEITSYVFVIKKVSTNMCPIVVAYRVTFA
jgi:hypothetical protein